MAPYDNVTWPLLTQVYRAIALLLLLPTSSRTAPQRVFLPFHAAAQRRPSERFNKVIVERSLKNGFLPRRVALPRVASRQRSLSFGAASLFPPVVLYALGGRRFESG